MLRLVLVFCCVFGRVQEATAQARNRVAVPDSAAARRPDTTISLMRTRPGAQADSLTADSIAADTTAKAVDLAALGIRISPDALTSVVTAEAEDSSEMDLQSHIFRLYGNAHLTYDDMKLDAGQLTYEQNSGTVIAFSPADTSMAVADTSGPQLPSFNQGEDRFTFDTLQYNFNTKKAIVRNARTQYGEGFVRSNQVKRSPDGAIFGLNSLYTTCALDTPHFGIRTRRIKVIPGKVAVSGSANLEIEGVPTPVFLPFGLFPVSQKQRSGFRLPTYTLEGQRGLGLTNGGYYFHISDYIDLLATANIFSKGSWAVSGITNYSKRYRYGGVFALSYAYNKTGEVYEPGASITRDFLVNWSHQKDAKSRPGINFNAQVTAGTSSFYANNSYNTNQILQNQYQSNITFSKNWIGRPYSLTVSAQHNQNTATKQVNVTLPNIAFYVAQFNPFEKKSRVGNPRWYERITSSYSLSALALTTFYDTAFHVNDLSLSDFRTGIKQTVPILASYTILRYINFSAGVNYSEYWLQERFFQSLDTAIQEVDTVRERGFFTTRDFNATAQLSTRIYGLKMFKRGRIAGLRHVLTPNVGINYTPDFAAAPFSNYYQTVLTTNGNLEYRSPYEGSPIGTPGLGQYGTYASTINFGLNNNLQMKLRGGGKKDTTGAQSRNISLIDGLGIASAYNLSADSFNWAPLSINFRTAITNVLNISGTARYDPYAFDRTTGRRSQQTQWATGGGLARFEQATVGLQASFRSKTNTAGQTGQRSDEVNRMVNAGGYNQYIDFNIPWSLNVSYSLTADKVYRTYDAGGDTLRLVQNFLFNGDFNLTPRWKLTFNSGYDLTTKQLTLTSIDIYRDLHCWEMRLGTIPFGPRKSYNFSLNVKASVLQDLRLLRRRDFRDALY